MPDQWQRPDEGPLPGHVTTPLLTRIIEQSMDEDYLQVAERESRRAAQGDAVPPAPASHRPQLIAAAVIVVFGIMVTTAAVQTSRNEEISDAGRATLVSRVQQERSALDDLQADIVRRQDAIIAQDAQLDSVSEVAREEIARTRRLQVRTGFVPVRGPGVRIVVDDPPTGDVAELVRDEDLALLVDGLWQAGAEAVAINNQRLTALTSIRNEGPAVNVNSRPVNAPYVVSAIGDTLTLQADLLSTTHGQQFFDLAEDLGFLYEMQNVEELSLPGARSPRLRHVQMGPAPTRPRLQDPEEEINP